MGSPRIEVSPDVRSTVDFERHVQVLLRSVPHEDLMGLDAITLLDDLTDRVGRKQGSRGLYWPKTSSGLARIEVAVGAIFRNAPPYIFWLPVLPRLALARVLYHEIGHHRHHVLQHGVGKSSRERFADQYAKQRLQVAFRTSFRMLKPFRGVLQLVLKGFQWRRGTDGASGGRGVKS